MSGWQQVHCPYCQNQCKLVDSKIVYRGRSFGMIYLCSNFPDCDAYVGARNGSPLGSPARHELRELRKRCHAKLDPLWQSGKMTRTEAYEFLRKIMGLIDLADAHVAQFNEERCRRFLSRIECPTCTEYPGVFGPSHEGSRSCNNYRVTGQGAIAAGGTTAHCTCDACF